MGLAKIIGYPIVKLAKRHDVVGFVRELESGLIEVCREFGIDAERYCERSGVWISRRKRAIEKLQLSEFALQRA